MKKLLKIGLVLPLTILPMVAITSCNEPSIFIEVKADDETQQSSYLNVNEIMDWSLEENKFGVYMLVQMKDYFHPPTNNGYTPNNNRNFLDSYYDLVQLEKDLMEYVKK